MCVRTCQRGEGHPGRRRRLTFLQRDESAPVAPGSHDVDGAKHGDRHVGRNKSRGGPLSREEDFKALRDDEDEAGLLERRPRGRERVSQQLNLAAR